MTDTSRLICSITALLLLALFLLVEYLSANFILKLYIVSTSDRAILNMILFIPIMLFLSIKSRDFGFALFLIILITGQVMFVHVYADNYTIATSFEKNIKTNKTRIHYSRDWNKA